MLYLEHTYAITHGRRSFDGSIRYHRWVQDGTGDSYMTVQVTAGAARAPPHSSWLLFAVPWYR